MSNCVEEAIIKSESAAVDIKIEKPFLSTDDDITAESQLTDYLEIKSEQPELLFDVNCVKEEPSVDLGVDFINEQNNEEHLLENVERTFNERSNDQNSKSDSLKKKIVKSAKNVKHRKLFTCYICNFRANRLNLKEHLKIHIEDGNDIQYKCHVCSYKASSNSLLRAHLYTHSDEKPHKCDECDYQAKYR